MEQTDSSIPNLFYGSSVFWSPAACLYLAEFVPSLAVGNLQGLGDACVITGLSVNQPDLSTPPNLRDVPRCYEADGHPCLLGSWEGEELSVSLARHSVNSNCHHYDF